MQFMTQTPETQGKEDFLADNEGAKAPTVYKKTEVGYIPNNWELKSLGLLVKITSGESPSRYQFKGEGIPYFKVEQLNNGNKYLENTPYYFTGGDKKIASGSVIFPKRGASIFLNKVNILLCESFMDTNLMALTPQDSLDSEYLYYALKYIQLWRIADTTSIPQINNKHINPLLIPLPAKDEQKAIAKALRDVDELIEGLDKLIAKKRNIKQATMQQLVTGKRRLPGFSGEWENAPLGKYIYLQNGFAFKSNEFANHGVPILRISNIHNGSIDLNDVVYCKEIEKIPPEFVIRTNDALIAMSGATTREIA